MKKRIFIVPIVVMILLYIGMAVIAVSCSKKTRPKSSAALQPGSLQPPLVTSLLETL